jgi:hypothetical protein
VKLSAVLGGTFALVLALSSCGGDTELKSVDAFLKENESFPQVRPDGRLTADPPPLTKADVDRQPTNSPRQAVIRLWYLAQAGHPNVTSMYEPAVQQSVGLPELIGAFSLARSTFAVAWPRVVKVVPGAAGTTVDVLAFTKGAPPARETFVLRRRRSDWRIAYDSLLATWLEAYVQSVHDAGAPAPSKAGRAAGLQASKRYRDGFARTLEPRSRQAFLRELNGTTQSGAPDASAQEPLDEP